MSFEMPRYKAPDFGLDIFRNAPDAAMAPAERDGIVPPAWYTGLSQTAWTWWRPAT